MNLLKGYRVLFFLLLVIYLSRLMVVGTMGLMPQDAYYYYYAKHLALSYYDHPPMIAYMLRLFVSLLGEKVFVLKLADFAVSMASIYFFYKLSLRFLSVRKAFDSFLLLGSTILFTIISMVSTPDVPLLLFWTLSLLFFKEAIDRDKAKHWILCGVMIGLAFDSKYTAVFLLMGVLLFIVLSKPHRKYLYSLNLYLLLVSVAVVILPVIIWNTQHDWGSFGFQGGSRAKSILTLNFRPQLTIGLAVHQLVVLLPILFGAMIYFMSRISWRFLKRRRLPSEKMLFLLCFSLPLLLFFTLLSPIYWIKLNWLMPAYISGTMLTAIFIGKWQVRRQLQISVGLHLLLLVQIVFYPVNLKTDDTWWGWDELAETVGKLRQQYPDEFLFSTDGYKTSAILSFYFSDMDIYSSNVLDENGLQFSIEHSCLKELAGRNALLFDSDKSVLDIKAKGAHDPRLDQYFEKIIELEPILLRNGNGRPLRKFLVYHCIGYDLKCSN